MYVRACVCACVCVHVCVCAYMYACVCRKVNKVHEREEEGGILYINF